MKSLIKSFDARFYKYWLIDATGYFEMDANTYICESFFQSWCWRLVDIDVNVNVGTSMLV